MVKIRSIAIFACSNSPAFVFEVFVGPAIEAHILFADGADYMVASLLLTYGHPAVAAWFAELENG